MASALSFHALFFGRDQVESGIAGPDVVGDFLFHGLMKGLAVEVLLFPQQAGGAGGVRVDHRAGGIPDLPRLAVVVKFEGGGALDVQRAECGQVQGLGVEAVALACRVKPDGEGVHGWLERFRMQPPDRARG